MNSDTKVDTFVKSPLVIWAKSLTEDLASLEDSDVSCHTFCDGYLLQDIFDQIDSNLTFQKHTIYENSHTFVSRLKNLSKLLFRVIEFYEQNLGQLLVLRLPDIVNISKNPEEEYALDDLRLLILLILGSAVQCEQKEHFIQKIKQLDLSTQHEIVDCIQQIADNPASVWITSEWNELNSLPVDEAGRMYVLLVQHCDRLVKERHELLQRTFDLILQLEEIKQCNENCYSHHSSPPSSPTSSGVSSLISPSKSTMLHSSCALIAESASSPTQISNANFHEQKSHLMVELAHMKSKVRRLHSELEEKNELVIELKEILEQNKEASNKLRHENLELIQEARSAKAYRDEVDVLTERVRKVDRLESEVQRYRDRMNELDYYKSRVEELREDNRILTETKSMLDEQLTVSRKRADQLPELEARVLQLQSYSDELCLQQEFQRDKIQCLLEEVSNLKVDKKAALEEIASLHCELSQLRGELNANECSNQNAHSNLLEQLNNDAAKRVLKLELENQKLQSLLENMKNNRSADSSYLNNNVGKVLNLDGDIDENTSPETLSEIDSGCVSLVEELNIRLEKLEKENIRLKCVSEKLLECETRCNSMEDEKRDLEVTVKRLRAQIDNDVYRCEQNERNLSQMNAENQRLQRHLDSVQKRLEDCQQENASLESENQKLQMTAQSLKNTMKRLNDLEREVTHLEGENHRLEQEKKSHEKEIARLKQAMDSKDALIDEYSGKLSSIELENKRAKNEFESISQTFARYKCVEKEYKEVSQELSINKKSLTTLRQELLDEKIKCQQFSAELERVNDAIHKACLKNNVDRNEIFTNQNVDWSQLIGKVLEKIVKQTTEQRECHISLLESTLKDASSENNELKVELQCLRQKIESGFDTKSTSSDALIDDLERKMSLADDENKNLRNENLTFKESQNALKMEIKSLEMKIDAFRERNKHLLSNQANVQVENSLLRASNASLTSQIANLESQKNVLKESALNSETKCKEIESNYRSLVGDHEALQKLHEQLNTDYEVLSASCATLKTSNKSLRAEHRAIEEQLKAWLTSKEELRKMKEAIECVAGSEHQCDCNKTREMSSQIDALREENRSMTDDRNKLQTELKMLQNIYKQLRSENNDLKLKHAALQGETADCKHRMSSLDVEVSKLSSVCESLSMSNNCLEEQRKTLVTSVSSLLSQYHSLLNEYADNASVVEKLSEVCAKKERFEQMVKEYENVAEKKKKVAVTAPSVVRRMQRSNTDQSLCLAKQNDDEKSRHRNSCPPIDENNEIYGRIWEAETFPKPIPSNAAILRPFRTSTNSQERVNCDTPPHSDEQSNIEFVPPPRPPPRTHLTVESRMTLNVVTSPGEAKRESCSSSPLRSTSFDDSHTCRSPNPSLNHSNFTRGTFRSNTISFGSPIRRQRQQQQSPHLQLHRNTHHIHHMHHHLHPHIHAPLSHSECANGSIEVGDVLVNTDACDQKPIANHSHSNVARSPSSSCTNSVWYEYGCV